MENLEHLLYILGVKLSALIAGVFGVGVSLMYEKVSTARAIVLLLSGSFGAGYLTPLFASVFNLSTGVENSIAFLLGLVSMRLMGGIINISRKFYENPIGFIKSILKYKNSNNNTNQP